MELKEYSYTDLIEIYPQIIQKILEEIYDLEINFEHSPTSKYCSYC